MYCFKTGTKWQVCIIFSILHLGGYISESPSYIIIGNLVLQLGCTNKWLKRWICTSAKSYKVNLCYLNVIFDILGYFICCLYLDAFLLTRIINEILRSNWRSSTFIYAGAVYTCAYLHVNSPGFQKAFM